MGESKHFTYFEELNYFVYLVGRSHPDGLFKRGECGVGYTMFGPGIQDCPYGTMYVVPRSYIGFQNPSAAFIKVKVLDYYGVNFNAKEYLRNYLRHEEEDTWFIRKNKDTIEN